MTQPYREKPVEPPIHVEPRPRTLDDHFERHGGWVCAVLLATLFGGAIYWSKSHPPPPRSCADYANDSVDKVPARCTKNYDPSAP